ncbi:MAG: transcriptional regulator [Clostridiaceae bacterium]|nr:transcriptional regulator [Clostridiaceae bacterium]
MTFSEKLDLIMMISNTTNSALARAISIDSSFVSRLRRGVRNPARNENYLKPMAVYFAGKCNFPYQRTALNDVLQSTINVLQEEKSFPEDSSQLANLIYQWFLEDKTRGVKSVENLLHDVTRFNFNKSPQNLATEISGTPENTITNGTVFYGIKGKQAAVISFLSLVLKNKKPVTLLFYSDEDMEWLTGSNEFASIWRSLLIQVIMKGNSIKIIHTVNRGLDEILSSVEKWLPIYMTGAVEPYYYPKTRDGVFRRTLCIAPDTAVVTSSSVGSNIKNTANLFYTDLETISALTAEFNDYLDLCKPLMRIFTHFRKENYYSVLNGFEEVNSRSVLKTESLSTITMPDELAASIYSRSCLESDEMKQMLAYHKMRTERFKDSLQNHEFTEIITIPDIKAICDGKIIVNYSQMLTGNCIFYTLKEFRAHLQSIVRLLQTYDNYTVHLLASSELEGMIYAKEDVGVLFGRITQPSVLFATNESNMTSAFWEYMRIALFKSPKNTDQRKTTIDALNKIVEALID